MPRAYKKQSPYWEQPRKAASAPPITVNNITQPVESSIQARPFPDIVYGSSELITAHNQEARASGGGPPTTYRGSQTNNGLDNPAAFQNIRAMPAPFVGYNGTRSFSGMSDVISLCARAWMGVPVVKNAIEVAVEFSCQPIYIKSKNATVQTFYREWWNAIQGPRLLEQGMREYYRSGNVFWYAFFGKFGPTYFKNFQESFGAKSNKIPIRYELLNPTNVYVPNGLTFPYTYVRMLSTYEVERLRNPLTEQDKQVYQDLPDDVKSQIKGSSSNPLGIYVPMSPDRLRFMFYKKQDYEPMAVPMVWPVLPDIEWKLALKKMDMELARKIEHAILLVTTGEAPNQYNGGNGINQNNIVRLQNFLTNQTLVRTLVADYTTEAKWVMPDFKEALGYEKFRAANEDIKEGLQSILTGDDKFANAQIKSKIFIQRLEEGQRKFLNDFLMIEIARIADTMGFRDLPEVGFNPIDLQDEAIMSRVVAQLAQIGVLTATQAVQAIQTGVLPNESEMKDGQKEYKKDREDGLYEPLIGGQKDEEAGPNGRPGGSSGIKQSTKKVGPIGTKAAFSTKTYIEHLKASQTLAKEVEKALKKRFKIEALDSKQQEIAHMLVKRIVAIHPKDKWVKSVAATVKEPPQIPAEIGSELSDLANEYDVDEFDASLLRWCKTEAPESLV